MFETFFSVEDFFNKNKLHQMLKKKSDRRRGTVKKSVSPFFNPNKYSFWKISLRSMHIFFKYKLK